MATIDESQLQMNVKVFSDLLMQNAIHMNNGQLADTQAHRRRTEMISEASLAKGLELLYTVDPSEARGLRSLAQADAVDSTAVGGILSAMIQQALKGAQSTRPETGSGD